MKSKWEQVFRGAGMGNPLLLTFKPVKLRSPRQRELQKVLKYQETKHWVAMKPSADNIREPQQISYSNLLVLRIVKCHFDTWCDGAQIMRRLAMCDSLRQFTHFAWPRASRQRLIFRDSFTVDEQMGLHTVGLLSLKVLFTLLAVVLSSLRRNYALPYQNVKN